MKWIELIKCSSRKLFRATSKSPWRSHPLYARSPQRTRTRAAASSSQGDWKHKRSAATTCGTVSTKTIRSLHSPKWDWASPARVSTSTGSPCSLRSQRSTTWHSHSTLRCPPLSNRILSESTMAWNITRNCTNYSMKWLHLIKLNPKTIHKKWHMYQ